MKVILFNYKQNLCESSILKQLSDIHLTNVAIQKTSPDYDPEVSD